MPRFFIAVATLMLGMVTAGKALANEVEPTEVVVLGVEHSAMLVAESYQPAVFRAYIDRVAPDAICIERPPDEFARGSHYDFTYEIQDLVVPYAREKGIELCPFDWIPDTEDQLLAFGVDLANLPFTRHPRSYANFLTFPEPSALSRSLFYAESKSVRDEYRTWYETPHSRAHADFSRRLFLYRTYLQAMRIAQAAKGHQGKSILVIVGAMHKDEIEKILGDTRHVRVVPSTHFGEPTASEVAAHVRTADRAAIATFNLLGAQAATGNIDLDWLRRIVREFGQDRPGPEAELFDARLDVLTGELDPRSAVIRYQEIQAEAAEDQPFTWSGVFDSQRLDSFADPFGNLSVSQRAALEESRELIRLGDEEAAQAVRDRLETSLAPMQAGQLRAYWSEWVVEAR